MNTEAAGQGPALSEGLGLAPERADVAAVMTLVWSLVRSGPNFDGRQFDVQRAVTAALDNAVAAERERCAKLCEAQLDEPTSREWNMAVKCCAATLRA